MHAVIMQCTYVPFSSYNALLILMLLHIMSDLCIHAFTTGTSNGDGQDIHMIDKNMSIDIVNIATTSPTLVANNTEHDIGSINTSTKIVRKIDADVSLQTIGNEAHGKLS
jgi:hypothetical protein